MRIPWSFHTVFALSVLSAVNCLSSAHAQVGLKLQGEFYDFEVKERGGTFLIVAFKSRHPVVPSAVASRKPLTVKPKLVDFANPASDIDSTVFPLLSGVRDSHEIVFTNLRPGTLYFIGVIGRRNDGGEVFAPIINSKVTTRGRKLRATFTAIQMKNDSDDLSDGDFTFYFFAFDKKMDTKTKPLAAKTYSLGDDWIGSGETKSINVKLGPISLDEDTLWLAVSGMDSDPDTPGAFSTFPTGLVYKGSGSDPFHEWASGSRSISLLGTSVDGATYAAQEKYATNFTINVAQGDVSFKTFGTLEIWYE